MADWHEGDGAEGDYVLHDLACRENGNESLSYSEWQDVQSEFAADEFEFDLSGW